VLPITLILTLGLHVHITLISI